MKILALQINNVRGFLKVPKINFSEKINILIGPNNSGKSTILKTILHIQVPVLGVNDITIGRSEGNIQIFFKGNHHNISSKYDRFEFLLKNGARFIRNRDGGTSFQSPGNSEPFNLIYPYLSKRKVVNYDNNINEENANSVDGNFKNLYSKIDRLIAPQFKPGNQQYIEACNNILGFEISTLAKGKGKEAVYYIQGSEHITLNSMGEGVANILGLIVDLCVSEDKIFIIEEPENDIHPKALKALLKLIINKSASNQFFISTHSNIVMKYLGSDPNSKIFNVTNDIRDEERENLFISSIKEVPNNIEERRRVLEDLGYDFFDLDLWECWLFLEESSAETIVRGYLIKWFVKQLKGKIRTFSAGGVSNVPLRFEDFNKLFIFLHLEPTYKNRVWVVVDGGENEKIVIDKMVKTYAASGWNESNFLQLSEHNFEKYYPERFQEEVEEIIGIENKYKRCERKKQLLEDVIEWIASDESTAKEEFKKSSKEVIEILLSISKTINR